MALQQLIEQLKQVFENIKSLNVENALEKSPNINPWNNLEKDDYKHAFIDLIDIISRAFEQDIWANYSWNIISSATNNLNNVFTHVQQFCNGLNQNTFQNSLNQIESIRTSLRSWGIYSAVQFGQDIETKISLIDNEYQSVIGKRKEIEALRESVQTLIEPAVAGSLSKSFSDRQLKLEKNRKIWLRTAITAAVLSAIATVVVILVLIDVLALDIPKEATKEQIQTLIDNQPSNVGIHLLRIAILLPFYTLFLYAFNQYKVERNLEEEYAHRSAVSTSLPNYGDLAGDQTVKNQIISSATSVVFTSPIYHNNEKKVNETSNDLSVSSIKGLVESIGKIAKPINDN